MMDRGKWERLQQHIQMEEESRDFELLVAALRGLSDRQVVMLTFHLTNFTKPNGPDRDDQAADKFWDAWRAARALDDEARKEAS